MKRLFALLLCACILFGCAAATAFASDQTAALPFTDADSIRHAAECAIFHDLGVISGNPAGAFQPERSMTRAEVAVLVTALSLGAQDTEACTAADVYPSHWARGYIGYVLSRGYLTLSGGCYRPDELVSVRDFCCVLLRVIGYSDITADTLEAQIAACGLLAGYGGALDAPVTRDDACLLMYNAVCNLEVSGQSGEATTYYTDALLNPVTYLEHRFGVARYTEIVTGNGYADLTASGARLAAGETKLAEHRTFAVASDLSVLGHRADIVVRNGAVLGLPRVSTEERSLQFGSYAAWAEYVQAHPAAVSGDTVYYRNYDLAGAVCLQEQAARRQILALDYDADGVLDAVFVLLFERATVTDGTDLDIQLTNGRTAAAEAMDGGTYTPGEAVYAASIAGRWYVIKED